jgi:hypothetical protein
MAESSYNCSIRQGFNFEKDAQTLVGHLVSLKIGDITLKADLTLTLPTDLNTAAVVAAISSISWAGGYADPVYITCNISTANQVKVLVLQHTNLSKTDVEFAFNVYDFDQVNKVYYLGFHTDTKALKGLILKNGGDLAINIADDPSYEVPSPLNYTFQIGIMPQDAEAQSLLFAVSNSDKFAKVWGVKSK